MARSNETDQKYMQKLMRDFEGRSVRFRSHPIGTVEIVSRLTAVIDFVAMPKELEEALKGTEPALGLLGLLALNSLKLRFPQSTRDKPPARSRKTKRRGNLKGEEQDIVGLIIFWFKDIQPALGSAGSLSWRGAIGAAMKGAGSLVQVCQLAEPGGLHLQWIVPLLVDMYQQDKSGERSATDYYDRALLLILQRIEHYAARAGLEIEDVLPGLSGGDVVEPKLPVLELGWDALLATRLSDYRAYESQEIERLLREQGLASSFDWFLPRQVYRPVDQSRIGEEIPTLNLADICKPGLRTALLDHRGSGTTTALLWLSNQWCSNTADIEPVVLRLDAKDYKTHAANQSPVEYLARKIYGTGRDSRADRKEFEDVLDDAEIICLIDNLARLGPDDQLRIARQLGSASGLVFTASVGVSDEELSEIGGEGAVRAEMVPLGKDQVERFVSEFTKRCNSGFDEDLALRLARDMPDIATLPLGLAILCEQVRLHQSNCASTTARFISELFRRNGKPTPKWHQSDSELPPELRLPIRLVAPMYTWPQVESGDSLDFDEQWALRYLPEGLRDGWQVTTTSPLLIRVGPETYRFLNREVFGFLVAMGSIKGAAEQCERLGVQEMFKPGIVGIANRHYQAWIEHPDWIATDFEAPAGEPASPN